MPASCIALAKELAESIGCFLDCDPDIEPLGSCK